MEEKMCFSDLWVPITIDSLDSFGDVGYLHFDFLNKVLPHCSKQQLIHIQKETKDTDLSPIPDKLWKKFFETDFGTKATTRVMDEMKIKKSFMWSELYEAEFKRVEEAEKQVIERLKKSYENEATQKQNRQIKVLEKLPPPPPSKRNNLINNVKKRYLNSLEVRNRQAMKVKSAAPKCGSSFIKKPGMSVQALTF